MNELTLNIAASIFMKPCNEDELAKREFLKNYSFYGIQRIIMLLEKEAIYYRGETMFIYKKWAKKHLDEYELF